MQHNLRSISHEVEDISRSKRGASHFSSDLERGAAPRSIAVEKCEAPLIVIKIWHRHLLHFSQRWCTFLEPDCELPGQDATLTESDCKDSNPKHPTLPPSHSELTNATTTPLTLAPTPQKLSFPIKLRYRTRRLDFNEIPNFLTIP